MAARLSSSVFCKWIPKRVHFGCPISSVSCANQIQNASEKDQTQPNTSDFEAKMISLRSNFCPENVAQMLDSTSDLSSAVKLFKWAAGQKQFHHTAEIYKLIILKLGLNGYVHEMESFCAEMVRECCPGVEDTLVSLISSFVWHHRVKEAIQALVAMSSGGYKPSLTVFNVLMGALVEEMDFKSFLFVYKEMVKVGIAPTINTLNYLIEALFELDRVESVMDQFRRINTKGCFPNSRTYEIMISGLIARDRVSEATAISHEMLEVGLEPNESFYASTIPLFFQVNQLDEGLRLCRMMIASKKIPDSLQCDILIQCLCQNFWLDDAVDLLEGMIAGAIAVTGDMLENVIRGLCKLGRSDKAAKILEDTNILEVLPFNAMLNGYCYSGDYVSAQSLLEKMCEKNIADSVSWNIIIRWLCENDRIQKAFETLGRMNVASVNPDSATYSAFVVGNCKLNEYEAALELFHRVRASCWVLDSASYAELVSGLCQVEKLHEAVEVFCYMSSKRCRLQSSSFDMLISALCLTGELNKAIRLLPLAHCSSTPRTSSNYNNIMRGLARTKRPKDLLLILSQMLVDGCLLDVESYDILIQSTATEGGACDSVLLFNMMLREGLVPDSKTIANLLACIANQYRLHMILPAVHKLVFEFEILDSAACNILINGLWKEGYQSESRQILDLMLEKGWVPDAVTHGLLFRSAVSKETNKKRISDASFVEQDEVSSILAEGLSGNVDSQLY